MLYPPYIESKLPAQYGGTLKIPFRLNRTQSEIDINGKTFTALIKTVTTNKTMGTISTIRWEKKNGEYFANIQLDDKIELTIGQYYKIQLAYEGSTLYSSVGIFKYTSTPTVTCDFSYSSFVLTGTYQSNDPTEKVYMYKFDCFDEDKSLIETTGWKIHNSLNDTIATESQNTYIPQSAFNIEDASFSVKYSIKTINDIELSSELLKIELEWNELSSDEAIAENINIAHSKEFGLIEISYKQSEASALSLVRHSSTGFELIKFMINATMAESIMSYIDYDLEQGHSYTYYLCNSMTYQQLNEVPIKVDFEDMFLQDKDFILRIRYNPKMQSFKTVIMENKMETLGSQYPIILRNGNINYKEFSISGLLVAPEPLNTVERQQTSSINSISEFTEADSIYRERVYKLEVLDWLNNGKPKLFRSSTEGNYIVRLMNVSLSPEVQLGRKLHTFSATAYEIAPYNTQSLIDNNIIEG